MEEGRVVGGGARSVEGGAHVARLAAEFANTNTTSVLPKASKPKDLMRSVGKIEPSDWNVKEIERKIMENKLGRSEPKAAEKVPKWDREQFLGRQRRLKEGDQAEEKWGEIDDTIQKLEQKLKDSGRPDHGTKKVASLATKFVAKEEPKVAKMTPKEIKKSWRGLSSTVIQCVACGLQVFAAEGVTADGLHLHRACFRCALCKAVLRPGSYTMERQGCRLVCLRHSGVNVPDAVAAVDSLSASSRPHTITSTPERISLELSDTGAREIDEDEWTDRNFLASETSCAGGLSDEEDSSSDEYRDASESEDQVELFQEANEESIPRLYQSDLFFSDDSFGYDDYSDDGADTSGNESCSKMRAAREARRREVPADARPPTESSEVESEQDSESSDEEVSSATEVSTDSEFAREECATVPSPPAILVTEAPPPAPPPIQDYPLSRTRSAGGLATKRALELKRRYLLGEPSPPAVRKSDSTSQLDTKLETFRSNISEFQKMLHPAPTVAKISVQKPAVTFQFTKEEKKIQPMPDIIQNLVVEAPVDLLTKGSLPLSKEDSKEPMKEDEKDPDLDSDSLSDDDPSFMETVSNQSVPRVEIHDEGGELIQLDSLIVVNSMTEENEEKASGTGTATGPTVAKANSESSESCHDALTLALTETELSDWAVETAALDDYRLEEKDEMSRSKNPRALSGLKLVHNAKNISPIASHVCGRTSPLEPIAYSNAFEHFEFADEGDQDTSADMQIIPHNKCYMELVDDDHDPCCLNLDRSINFIERSFPETLVKSTQDDVSSNVTNNTICDAVKFNDNYESDLIQKDENLKTSPINQTMENELRDDNIYEYLKNKAENKNNVAVISKSNNDLNIIQGEVKTLSLSDMSPLLENNNEIMTEVITQNANVSFEDLSPPLAQDTISYQDCTYNIVEMPTSFQSSSNIRVYSPAICRSVSENFNRFDLRSKDLLSNPELSLSVYMNSVAMPPVSPTSFRDITDKVQEIKREREEQTEVVRRLVLDRLGSGTKFVKKSTRRMRVSPASNIPPPLPPPPVLLAPPPPPPPTYSDSPPRPVPPLMPLPVTPSFSDPELARERRRKSIMKSITNYLNRRLAHRHKWVSEPDLTMNHERSQESGYRAHKSTGTLQEGPPIPPPPACYSPPVDQDLSYGRKSDNKISGRTWHNTNPEVDAEEREATLLWFEARCARLVEQRRVCEHSAGPSARRLAFLQRRLARPLSAEKQAAAVAEIVQVSAQREAHQAMMAADRRRSASGGVGD